MRTFKAVLLPDWIALSRIALACAASVAARAATDLPPLSVLVHADGAVSLAARAAVSAPDSTPQALWHRYAFGLPATPPTLRRMEDEKLPVARTQWEANGIRYTQVVLVTRLETGGLMTGDKLPNDAVVLVQVVGENTATEYTEATAGFTVQVGGQAQEVELHEDRICELGREDAPLLALVEIPPTGIGGTRGPALRFRGSMPPGTSGAMTLKIPLNPLRAKDDLNRLRELDFDEELRRVRRYWGDQVNGGTVKAFPLGFASERVPPPGGGS